MAKRNGLHHAEARDRSATESAESGLIVESMSARGDATKVPVPLVQETRSVSGSALAVTTPSSLSSEDRGELARIRSQDAPTSAGSSCHAEGINARRPVTQTAASLARLRPRKRAGAEKAKESLLAPL